MKPILLFRKRYEVGLETLTKIAASERFKRAICLFILSATSLLFIKAIYHNQSQPTATPSAIYGSCAIYLIILVSVMISRFKFKQKHLYDLQLVLLISSSTWAAALSIKSDQLIALQPIIMFIIYTLVAVDNVQAFIVTLAANLVQLLIYPFKRHFFDNKTQNSGDTHLISVFQEMSLIATVYMVFHGVGWYLNRESHNNCRRSFHDIRSYVSSKIELDAEDKKLTKLLESVIPKHLAGQMREDVLLPHNRGNFNQVYLESFKNVSILFADIVNFTKISSNCSAQVLVVTLNELFGRFDKAADKHHCLRIKILGDCYYCVSGIPDMNEDHAKQSVEMGLEMIDILGELAQDNSGVDLNMRVGIHSGRVLCGVLGKKKWQFDVHSLDVKLANHTEQSGTPGRVHITEDTLKALDGKYEVEVAFGHKRDTYIAARNILTYFVIAPPDRRNSMGTTKLISSASLTSIVQQNSSPTQVGVPTGDSSQLTHISSSNDDLASNSTSRPSSNVVAPTKQPSKMSLNSLATATTMYQLKEFQSSTTQLNNNVQLASSTTALLSVTNNEAAKSRPPTGRAVSNSTLALPNRPQQAPKQRFKHATQRLINALHFIRTIDAPFANLETPRANAERMMYDTIASRSQIKDIHKLRLKFKDEHMGHLYGPISLIRVSKRSLIYILALICLAILAHQTLFHASIQLQHYDGGHDRMNAALDNNNEQAPAGSNGNISIESKPAYASNHNAANDSAQVDRNTNTNSNNNHVVAFIDDNERRYMMSEAASLMAAFLIIFILTAMVYAHQAELNSRRDFLWRQIALGDKDRMARMRDANKFIFFNLLPPHVASYFLKQGARSHTDLYYKSYDRIGVVFATVANFSDFYSEDQGSNNGLECLRLLNEILFDFDSLLDEDSFKAVDKIKAIGSTYMAAIGLFPEFEFPAEKPDGSDKQEVANYLDTLIGFVFEMKTKLKEINEHSYNNFKLRIGINIGPVTAGVIGASKPQYDIWGNTVNVASRMETTAETDKIQITDEVYQILKDHNTVKMKTADGKESEMIEKYEFFCRGSINVKGKGFMTTYYLDKNMRYKFVVS